MKKNNYFIGLNLNKRSIQKRNFMLEIPFPYKFKIKELIDAFKFYRDTKAGKRLVDLVLETLDSSFNSDLIVPVPSHIVDNSLRGYETMSYLGNIFSKKLAIPMDSVLRKNFFPLFKRTKKKKKRAERLESFGNFKLINTKKIYNKNILLIDDIWTTGSTIRELVDLLYFNGAKSIKVLIISLA